MIVTQAGVMPLVVYLLIVNRLVIAMVFRRLDSGPFRNLGLDRLRGLRCSMYRRTDAVHMQMLSLLSMLRILVMP